MPESGTRPRLLIADDDQGSVDVFRVLFSRDGFEIDVARDGQSALGRIMKYRYEVILLDLHMPRMTGFELLRTIRDQSPALLRRIIVISAMSETHFRAPVFDGETFARFSKPGDLMALEDSIRECAEAAGARLVPKPARNTQHHRMRARSPT